MKPFNFLSATLAIPLLCASAAMAAGDPEAGKAKAVNCAGCHGANGEGAGDNPALAGMDAGEQLGALQAYKSGERQHAMMQMFAGQLGDQDMADIAAYYATLGGE
jgi:cytochrome c553